MATKEQLPTLAEAHICTLASAQSFERGTSYFHGGAILDPVRQGMELRASCEGSAYEPYQVNEEVRSSLGDVVKPGESLFPDSKAHKAGMRDQARATEPTQESG